ncbi:MAG: LysR family substrate-binding domain-containing protein [Amaricoccus sp.]
MFAIDNQRVDVAFLADTSTSLDCDAMKLWSERVILTVPKEHKLAKIDEVRWNDLLDQTLLETDRSGNEELGLRIRMRFEEAGRYPHVRSHSIGQESLISLVAMGWGLTLVAEAMTALHVPGIVYRPMVDEAVTFSAVWLRENSNPALRHLLAMARAMSAVHAAR